MLLVLNMLGFLDISFPKFKKNLFIENIRRLRFLKIRKAFFEKVKEIFSEPDFLGKNKRNILGTICEGLGWKVH